MKRILALLVIPVLMMVLVIPVQAQVNLPFTTDIITDGRDTASDVGDFTVDFDGTVTFQIDEAGTNWRLAETQLYVGDEPPLKSKPDKFPYKHEGLGGIASDVYNFDFSAADLNGDGIVYIAAHVTLIMQTGVNPKSKKPFIANETAWAQGDEFTGKGKNWITFFSATPGRIG
jgi:hypothetical protein